MTLKMQYITFGNDGSFNDTAAMYLMPTMCAVLQDKLCDAFVLDRNSDDIGEYGTFAWMQDLM